MRNRRQEWNDVNSKYEKLTEAYRKTVQELQQMEAERVQVQAAGATVASLDATLDFIYRNTVAVTASMPGVQGQ